MPEVTAKRPALRVVLVNILVLTAILVLVEGLAGYGLFAGRFLRGSQLAERRHTQYDPLLGWVNAPGVIVPDLYGKGITLTTNRQGFRNVQDVERAVPAGRTRVICSGDSYTLGYGVGDEDTWCRRLTVLDPRIDTVNMGQGGYGFDQAYLWYKRDGAALEHQLHVFAFIDDDFGRMGGDEFWNYRKPVLKVINGALATTGVPVPGPKTGFVHRVLEYGSQLNTARMAQFLARSIFTATPRPRHESVAETSEVVVAILDDLVRLNAAHSSRLVLLMLPIPEQVHGGEAPWRSFIKEEAARRNILFIDGFTAFESVPKDALGGMFIQEGALDYPGAGGHLTPRGNEFTAKIVYDSIKDALNPQ